MIVIAFLLFYLISTLFLPVVDISMMKHSFLECFWIVLFVEILISILETFLLLKPKRKYLELAKQIDEKLKPFGLSFRDWMEYREPETYKRVRWRKHYRHLGSE